MTIVSVICASITGGIVTVRAGFVVTRFFGVLAQFGLSRLAPGELVFDFAARVLWDIVTGCGESGRGILRK